MGNELITHEEKARHAKASAIAEVFMAKKADAATLRNLDAAGWKAAAALAGVNAPSEKTKAEVISRVEVFSTPIADPFACFPKAGEFE